MSIAYIVNISVENPLANLDKVIKYLVKVGMINM